MTRVLVVVPFYRPDESGGGFLASVLAQESVDLDLLIVDNSPRAVADMTRHALGARLGLALSEDSWRVGGIHFQLVGWPQNLGPGAAFAHGAEVARQGGHSHVWFLDQDMRPESDCLRRLIEASLAQNPPSAAVPRRRNPATGFEYRAYRFFGKRPKPLPPGLEAEADLVVYSGLLVPTSFLRPGIVPTDYFIDWDDLALCVRLRRQGMRIKVVPQAKAAHESGNVRTVGFLGWRFNVATWLTFRYYYIARNRVYLHRELKAWKGVGPWRGLMAPLLTMAILILWGSDRLAKLRNILRGLADSRRDVRGKRPDRALGSPAE